MVSQLRNVEGPSTHDETPETSFRVIIPLLGLHETREPFQPYCIYFHKVKENGVNSLGTSVSKKVFQSVLDIS